eukprot:380712_1
MSKTLAASFNDNSIKDADVVKIWEAFDSRKQRLNYMNAFQHSPSELQMLFRVSSQNACDLSHAHLMVDHLVNSVSGFQSLDISSIEDKYNQPQGGYSLDVRFPSKRKSPLCSWGNACLREMDKLNAIYQLDEDTPTLKVRVYDKTAGFKLEEYNSLIHGGYTCNSTSFSTLGQELNTFPAKSLMSDEWKGTFVQFSTSSCGMSHTPFLSLFEQRPWNSKNGSTTVLAPKIRFNMWGAIQPTQCLRFLKG